MNLLRNFIGNSNDETETNSWVLSPDFGLGSRKSTCGALKVVGGFQKFGAGAFAERTLTGLVPHYSARIRLLFLRIDSWDAEMFKISIDNVDIRSEPFSGGGIPSTPNPNYCGDANDFETQRTFSVTFTHTATQLKLKLYTNLDESASLESWGFSNVEIVLYKCHSSCLACSGPLEAQCTPVCETCPTLTCGDYNYLKAAEPGVCTCPTCDRCHISCKTCDGPNNNNCLSCESQDTYSNTLRTCSYPTSKMEHLFNNNQRKISIILYFNLCFDMNEIWGKSSKYG